jgi:hypothetical protein
LPNLIENCKKKIAISEKEISIILASKEQVYKFVSVDPNHNIKVFTNKLIFIIKLLSTNVGKN